MRTLSYDDIQHAIMLAVKLNRVAPDSLLVSAVALLVPYLDCSNDEVIDVKRAGSKAYDFIHRMRDAYITLYG